MQHTVQFFDLLETLAESVARFVQESLAAGHTTLIVARASSVAAIEAVLHARGVSLSTLIESGHVVVRDAAETLRTLMGRHMPDAREFDTEIAPFVRRLVAGSPGGLAIYGEMVDILAAEGNPDAAEALERMWNRLGEQVPFRLFCGYAAAHFAGTAAAHRHLQTVCELHTEVHRDHADLLASWLLSRVEPAL